MDKFPCTECGLCCRKLPATVPHQVDGVCIHLGEDDRCEIYDERPQYCRVDKMADWYGVSREKHFKVTANICNQWQEEAGLPERYRVRIEE